MKDALDLVHEITKLVNRSPRHDSAFYLEYEFSACLTRWTVKADTLRSIVQKYTILRSLWEESLEFMKMQKCEAELLA